MYRNVDIRNFRSLRRLTLDDLRRVNLFVGPNNSGKTSILEILWLLQAPGNPLLTANIASFRGMLSPLPTPDLVWYGLFRDMKLTDPIIIAGDDERNRYKLQVRLLSGPTSLPTSGGMLPSSIASLTTDTNGKLQILPTTDTSAITTETLQMDYEVTGAQALTSSVKWTIGPGGGQAQLNREVERPQSVFLATWQQSTPEELADRFTRVQDHRHLDDIVESLRVLQPGLSALTLGYIAAGRQPILRGQIGDGPMIPLRLFGGGVVRLAEILLAVLTSTNGTVLIDEIDTGLYYRNLESAWQAVNTASRNADAQVFATTHSFECVQAAVNAFRGKDEAQFRLYRLEPGNEGSVRVISYEYQDALAALDLNLEVR